MFFKVCDEQFENCPRPLVCFTMLDRYNCRRTFHPLLRQCLYLKLCLFTHDGMLINNLTLLSQKLYEFPYLVHC